MFRFVVLGLAALVSSAHSVSESPPEWSPLYSVSGVFYLPLSDVQEPFKAWFDIENNKSHVVYTGSGASVHVLPPSDSLPKGSFRKVFSTGTEEAELRWDCIEMGLESVGRHPPIESVLPDMADYRLIGTESLLENEVTKWQKVVTEVNSRTEFTVWVKAVDDESIPLKYEVNVYNTLLGTHGSHFYLEYNEYYKEFNPSVFDKSNDMTCVVSEKVKESMNPMEASLYSVRAVSAEHHFERFKLIHGRRYASDLEHEERLAIFRHNLEFINEHNRGNSTYKMAVNHLADRTNDELNGLLGNIRSTSDNIRTGLPFPYSSAEIQKLGRKLPKEFDWRLRGAVTPVKDQLSCGSCWAFSAVGAVEGALFLHNEGSQHVLRLSEQALVDCSWSYKNGGCMGGSPDAAFEWIKDYGLPTYEAYGGYLAENGKCHIENVTSTAFIEDWVRVKPYDETALKIAIFKHGPISVSFFAKADTLMFYSSGVYYDAECSSDTESINHSVLAVGYGVLDGQNYWLIKNSWGSWWGDNGYLLISTKNNNCGMMNMPLYAFF
ncbi:digestive cysteine proteinase 3-like [Choristoneura fumiferana]|uniref:digestive cysteine proteinase 3-like n=1 Tax=Choristoneura fumiferana TaxID=7141 RepID=UPI003D1562AD